MSEPHYLSYSRIKTQKFRKLEFKIKSDIYKSINNKSIKLDENKNIGHGHIRNTYQGKIKQDFSYP